MPNLRRLLSADSVLFAVALSLSVGASLAQEGASIPSASGEPKKDINDTPPVNPLQGLFQMQPQYPTPGTTQMFPEAVPSHMGNDGNVPGRNPGTAGTTYQQNFPDTSPKKEEKIERTDNGIKGLFQMQPQYPTPGTTQMFPEAKPKFLGDDSSVQGRQPGTAAGTYSVPWKDPYAPPEEKSKDKTDYLKNLFQMQPQYPTPGATQMFPTATSPQYGPDGNKPGQQPGQASTVYQEPVGGFPTADASPVIPGTLPGGAGGGDASKADAAKDKDSGGDKKDDSSTDKKDGDADKKDADKKDGDTDKKDSDKKDGDTDKKDADKKDADKKDADKKDADKKDGDKKDADKKDGDKKDGDKKDGDKKDADKKDGDKKDGDKKDADKKDDEKKDGDKKDGDKDKKEEVKYLPFNPVRESINLLNTGRLTESYDLLTREIKKNPKNAQAFYIRAMVQVKMRQYDKAAADYNEVLKIAPTGELATRSKLGLQKIHF